jgi:cell wall-associated NlpC family hydrolase
MTTTPIGVADVLAVRTGGIGGWLIRLGAQLRGLPCGINHIVIAHHVNEQGRWIGLEGRPGGVGWVDMTNYLRSPATVDNREQPKTEGQRYLVAKAAERLIGTAYDWQAIGEDALVDLGVPLAHIDWSGPNPPLHVICSSFAEWAYRQVGLDRPEPSQGEALVQPGDWAAFDLAKAWNVAVKA